MIPGLIIFCAIVILIAAGVAYVKSQITEFSRKTFGTDSISDGLNRISDEVATTPKSVSSLTRIMLPQITRDFPEFNWDEFKHKAENLLRASLTAIDSESVDNLPKDVSEEVRLKILGIIENNRASQIKEQYDSILIHQTEIANYSKGSGRCTITIQSALQCYHYKEKDGQDIHGEKERLTQTKFNVELIYIQDVELAGMGNAVGVTCPNCGAPIKNLGAKFCEFCGSGVTPINIKVWSLHNFDEVNYNHV